MSALLVHDILSWVTNECSTACSNFQIKIQFNLSILIYESYEMKFLREYCDWTQNAILSKQNILDANLSLNLRKVRVVIFFSCANEKDILIILICDNCDQLQDLIAYINYKTVSILDL